MAPTSPTLTQSVILCEGVRDRAFWAGWLLDRGCSSLASAAGKSRRTPVFDPWKEEVERGMFGYASRTGAFIRVVPCGSRRQVTTFAATYLRGRPDRPLRHLVVSVDSDAQAEPAPAAGPLNNVRSTEGILHREAPGFVTVRPGRYTIDGGAVPVSLVQWEATDPHCKGVPAQQTMERLVCCALRSAYPERADHVEEWLSGRPDPPAAGVKEYAWSHMAGWYAERGCDDFYQQLWREEPVRKELETRLRATGAWDIVEELVS